MAIVAYPKIGTDVKVFEVKFKDADQLSDFVKGRLDNLEEAEQKNDLLLLPLCPMFTNDEGKCPLFVKCHSKAGKGCTR